MSNSWKTRAPHWLLPIALLVTAAIYWPGLYGSWLFDDYPNIVDNPGVQPHEVSVPALVRAALSSPASDFKRPLASLSFAANYLASGLNPWGWKLVNLMVHLLNGVLVFLLAKSILRSIEAPRPAPPLSLEKEGQQVGLIAALIAASWMLLPINLTAVLYVVQREESMANLFVLLGLIGYLAGRQRMLYRPPPYTHMQGREKDLPPPTPAHRERLDWSGFWICVAGLVLPTAIGLLAKETAAMLPLYACLIEWILFRFRCAPDLVGANLVCDKASGSKTFAHPVHSRVGARDWRIISLFACVLLLPLIIGLAWLLPSVLNQAGWATRDFTLNTRLLSEARVVCDYIVWTLLPTPHALSFYHDEFRVSIGLLSPWTTLASLLTLACLVVTIVSLRNRHPLAALGIALFLGCQLLTGTILPLELVYEHRNYFASFGVLLAVVPCLAGAGGFATETTSSAAHSITPIWRAWLSRGRHALLAALLLWWAGLTAVTAFDWSDPLLLAQELAERAPYSPRAQYELGRTYIIYSHYDPASPYTRLAYAPLEKAASFPESSILPQQALIFMNSRMRLPLNPQWWDSLIAKLKARKPGVQDESSLAALAKCAGDGACPLSTGRMVQAFEAALDHPNPSARLQATYGDYAWNMLGNHTLGLSMIEGAVKSAPSEPAYRITLVRMLAARGNYADAWRQIQALQALNIGGRLARNIAALRTLLPSGTKD